MRTVLTIFIIGFNLALVAQTNVSISGIAFNEDLLPIEGQAIEIYYDSCGTYLVAEVTSDENGVYNLDFLACESGFVLVYADCAAYEDSEVVETSANFYLGNYDLTVNLYDICPSDTSCSTHFTAENIDSTGLYTFTPTTIGGNQNFTYQWLVEGDTITSATLHYTFQQSGYFPIELIATDGNGVICTYTETVAVLIAIQDCGFEWQRDSSTGVFSFQANLSGGVAPIEYEWHFDDGNFSTSSQPNYTYSDTGSYEVCLYLIDGVDATCNTCQTIDVGVLQIYDTGEEEEEDTNTTPPVVDSCLNSALIDLDTIFSDSINAVCGCDGVSYQNKDIAIKGYGVSSYDPYPCTSNPTLYHFNIETLGENLFTLNTIALDGQVYDWSVTGEDSIFSKNSMAITFEETKPIFSKKVCMHNDEGFIHCKTIVFESTPQCVISGQINSGYQEDLALASIYKVTEETIGTEALNDVAVVLQDISGNIIAQTYTDDEGNYTFDDINFGFYYIIIGNEANIQQLEYPILLKPEKQTQSNFNLFLNTENTNSTNLTYMGLDRSNVNLFPNPANEQIQILHPFQKEVLQIQVMDMLGQIQFKKIYRNFNSSSLSLEIGHLANGKYQVEIACQKGHFILPFIKLSK